MLNIKKENRDELNKIFKEYCPNAEIWAYGSRVNGDFHSGSDLDLVVKDFHDKNKTVYELKELINNSDLPFLVDIQEFDKLPCSFQDEIKKKYVKIFPADVKEIIEGILKGEELINKNEVFLSEADFQLNFARCLDKNEDISEVILEYPMRSNEIYAEGSIYFNNDKKYPNKDKSYIDIYFKYKEKEYYIELKYKTAELDVIRHGNKFTLKPQGAYNIGLYDIYEDIERIEHIVNKENEKRHGFVIVITNDKAYWNLHEGNSANFILVGDEKTTNNCKFFNDNTKCEKCSKKRCSEEDKYYLGYLAKDDKNRKRPLQIKNSYPVKWKPWGELNTDKYSKFKYLIIEIPNQEENKN